jgi:hypothetical protein
MYEHVPSGFGFDKAEAFGLVEPFDFSLHRRFHPPFIRFFKGGFLRRHKKTTAL